MRISKKELDEIRSIDLLSYLYTYYPEELVKKGAGYSTKLHDSIYISNGMWCRFKTKQGSQSALDYLIYVEGYDFKEAIKHIRKLQRTKPLEKVIQKKLTNKSFSLCIDPKSIINMKSYLIDIRYIDEEIVDYCINRHILYESKNHDAVVFVGNDEHGIPRFATNRYFHGHIKKEQYGSDKRYSFNIEVLESDTLHVFESAIDLLSYLTIQKLNNNPYLDEHYLSLSGISGSSHPALSRFLDNHDSIKFIYLHLDNDEAGIKSTKEIMNNLKDKYYVFDKTSKINKDINEELEVLINGKVHN